MEIGVSEQHTNDLMILKRVSCLVPEWINALSEIILFD